MTLMLIFLWSLLVPAFAGEVHVLHLRGGVDPGSADYLIEGIRAAEEAGAELVVLELDTPGGLVSSARDMVQAELNSKVPIVVWVGPSGARAASAGVFLTMAAHVAAMAPGTTIGAAHPVSLFGGGGGGDEAEPAPGDDTPAGPQGGGDPVMEAKILNDTVAWARSIAEQRDRNADWAEQAVRESVAVTDREAVDLDIVDLQADSLESLLLEIDGRLVETAAGARRIQTAGATIVRVELTVRQRVVHTLADPNLLMALVALGMLGLYIEFQSPGLVIPGVVGLGLLLTAAVGLSVLPFNLAGLLLVAFAFGAFALEATLGGHGAYAVAGAGALLLGGVLLFDVEGYDLRVDTIQLLVVVGVITAVALGIGTLVAGAYRRKPTMGSGSLVGAIGVVTDAGAGRGWVRVNGEDWSATWDGALAVGASVQVERVDGLLLRVRARRADPAPVG
jgi:membrane-bound serine protease (ClpP class)